MRTTKDKRRSQLQEARQRIAAGKYPEADTLLSSLLASYPGDPEVCRLLATLHLKRGQLQVAQSEIKFLATAAMRAEDYALAESMIREYLQVDPNNAGLQELLGQMYEEKGDRTSAVGQYAAAVDLLLAHPDLDAPERPAELYHKITELAPGSATAERLAAVFEPGTTGVQYAASSASPDGAAAPRTPVEPRTAAEGIPRPVVSMESDEDFRRLVSPSAEAVPRPQEAAQQDDVIIQKPTPSAPPAAPETARAEPAPSQPIPIPEPQQREAPSAVAEAPVQEPVAWTPPAALRLADSPVTARPKPEPQPEPAREVPVTSFTAAFETASETPAFAVSDPQEDTPLTEAEEEPEPAAPAPIEMASSAPAWRSPAEVAPPARRRSRTRKHKPKRTAGDYKAMFLRSRVSRWMKNVVAAAQVTGRLTGLLVVASVVLPLLTIGGVAVTWLAQEQKPSETFQTLAAIPPQGVPDPKRNGYFLLLGLAVPPGADPMRAGYERWQKVELQRPRCTDPSEEPERPLLLSGDASTLSGWFRVGIPTTQFQERRTVLSDWTRANQLYTGRYEHWFTMPFEDAGYGTLTGPDCAQVLAVHRLYLASGFAAQMEEGVARLELDLTAWRHALTQARTLSMLLLALAALNDDVALLSDLLARPDLEPKLVPRLARLARPLEPAERSLRLPMHNEFLTEVRLNERRLSSDLDGERPLALRALVYMPVPKQKALNAHAAYYDAVMRITDVAHQAMPSLYDFAQSPPRRWADYMNNPMDNLLDLQRVPDWAQYAASIVETDARLRLSALQARLRVPSRDGAPLLVRVAEAGPALFDPFTELPMLTNGAKTLLYSVGRDRIDNNGDPNRDITVPIFIAAPAL